MNNTRLGTCTYISNFFGYFPNIQTFHLERASTWTDRVLLPPLANYFI